ncbi:P68 family surface lipoprotein [Mycoplasmopsis columbinasalis]|uniref:Uncharacterized lipoprotein MPN_097 n=1 Tax=Mycoplasmopsis columbinasalis TaxID=114880 RepID=A0A449B9T5_9BACT|nr:P80 family lipoprotein [Mycoplasmopsis columbinasalis]VEU77914.1 Uncharacterized lipoprotein MPN_097 precursor [Mycoplasmopsis columbinasalis]
MAKNKKTKWLLGGGFTLTSLVPLLAVSCGTESSTSTESSTEILDTVDSVFASSKKQTPDVTISDDWLKKNPKEIKFGVTFSRNGVQYSALNAVVEMYNKQKGVKEQRLEELKAKGENLTDDEKTEKADITKFLDNFVPVKIDVKAGGYEGAETSLQTAIENSAINELVSLTFNYASTASMLATKGMLLNFYSSADPNISSDFTNFNSDFTTDNVKTSNIQNTGTWILPAAKSSNVTGVNSPVLHYLLKVLEESGAKIELTSYETLGEHAKTDLESVKKLWGERNPEVNNGNLIINDKTFSTLEGLLAFGTAVKNTLKQTDEQKKNTVVLGIDDIAGVLATTSYAYLNGDDDKMFIKSSLDKSNTRVVDTSNFESKNSRISKKLDETFNSLVNAMKVNAVRLFAAGVYGSNDLARHKMALNIGSTAGYSHNYLKTPPTYFEFVKDNKKQAIEEGTNLDFVKIWKVEDGLLSFDKYQNRILTSTLANDDASYYYKKGDQTSLDNAKKHSFVAKDKQTDEKLVAVSKKISSTTDKSEDYKNYNNLFIFVEIKTDEDDPVGKAKHTILDEIANTPNSPLNRLGEFKKGAPKEEKTFVGYVTTGSLNGTFGNITGKMFTRTNADVLNQNELNVFAAPTRLTKDDKTNVVYVQGPSLIGVRLNKTLDNGTRQFVKFFLDQTKKYDFEVPDRNKTKIINAFPIDFFSQQASYVFPSKSLTQNDNSNIYLKTTIAEFIKVNQTKNADEKYIAYSEPASTESSKFRKSLKAVWSGINNEIINGEYDDKKTYDTAIIDAVKLQFNNKKA